ncbi:MAG: dephospho-CoA kinase [Longimicrobiales bacterium]
MKIVGLTGNVASGKSTVAELWRSWGVPVVSADALAREAVEVGSQGLREVADAFGPEVIQTDGALDRGVLRGIVFADDDARLRLEGIIHPRVRELRDSWTAGQRESGAKVVVWEVPLLFETGMDEDVDVVVLVDAPEQERVRRMVEHRGLSAEDAQGIMKAQGSAAEKRTLADILIENSGTRQELADQAAKVLARLRVNTRAPE